MIGQLTHVKYYLQLFIIFFSLQLEDAASKGKTETEKTIATMFDILKVNKKVRLENLVFNRISFAQTVENLFALSFLVKDGRVLIMVHDDGSHYVCMSFNTFLFFFNCRVFVFT